MPFSENNFQLSISNTGTETHSSVYLYYRVNNSSLNKFSEKEKENCRSNNR